MDVVATLSCRTGRDRWRRRALVGGGALGAAAGLAAVAQAAGILPAISPGYQYYADQYVAERWLNAVCNLLGPGAALLVAAGLGGVPGLLPGRHRLLREVSAAGALLAGASAVALILISWWSSFHQPHEYGVSSGVSLSGVVWLAAALGWSVGVLAAGVAALRVRGLRRARWLPLALGVAALPLPGLLESPDFWGPWVWPWAPLQLSLVVAGAGWALFGASLGAAREREAGLRRRENLAAARRLYETVWGEGDLAAVEGILAPEYIDLYYGRAGPEGLRRSVAGLRASFPDLRVAVRGQIAEGEEVETRWTASGTDLGGVLWYPPTGRRGVLRGVSRDRFEDGKLVEHRSRSDTAGLLEQLGLPPAAVGQEPKVETR